MKQPNRSAIRFPRPPWPSEVVSFVRHQPADETGGEPGAATMPAMVTSDYWIFAIGLGLVTLSVLVA